MKTEHDFPYFEARCTDILREALGLAALDGWNAMTLKRAVKAAGFPEGTEVLTFPEGVPDLLRFWSFELDKAMVEIFQEEDVPSLKIREKVALAVKRRLQLLKPYREAARRAQLRLLFPDVCSLKAKLIWATADKIWKALGDTSLDGNYYSKRAVLSGVYASTVHVWMYEEDEEKVWAFLERRLTGVMTFEKFKRDFKEQRAQLPSLTGTLAQLRYGRPRFSG